VKVESTKLMMKEEKPLELQFEGRKLEKDSVQRQKFRTRKGMETTRRGEDLGKATVGGA